MKKVLLSFLSCVPLISLAHDPTIHTSRENGRPLPLTKGEDAFQFAIYGDRTGGPAEGIEVLRQAVKDTNLLDPDLVMTVGDLIQGYNEPKEWMKQMEEFRGVMEDLNMPWYPVAGNHDIYWRAPAGAPKPPPQEHEDNYEEHFGPLWYWFAHKKNGFLVLYTDEGPSPKRFDPPRAGPNEQPATGVVGNCSRRDGGTEKRLRLSPSPSLDRRELQGLELGHRSRQTRRGGQCSRSVRRAHSPDALRWGKRTASVTTRWRLPEAPFAESIRSPDGSTT